MIEALVMTAVMASGPDHLDQPPTFNDIVEEQVSEINYKKPHKGALSDVISAASTIPKKWEPFAACVLDRESGATINNKNSGEGAKNPSSSASGRWQFLDNSWRDGLSHMVADQLKDHGMPKKEAKQVRLHLQSKPIAKWDGHFQDAGAIEVLQQGGWYHWKGASCNSKRP